MLVCFDLDHTLLRKSCGELYGRYLFRKGLLPFSEVLRITGWALAHRLNVFDVEEFLRRSTTWISGKMEAWIAETCEACVSEWVPRFLYEKGLSVIDEHRRRGDELFLLSAASSYMIKPIANYLNMDGFLATDLEVMKGKLTGKVIPPFCYGEGKLFKLRALCKQKGIRLEACAYYGDSYSDVPVLRNVGHPVAVNPDRKLKREATRNKWRVIEF